MIQASTKNITNFFSEGTLIIPDYQRQYSWGKEQVETLWSDLFNFFKDMVKENKNRKTYFLGNIIYSNLKDKDGNVVGKEIIDGQQRITTLMLILICLQNIIEKSITYKNNPEKEKLKQNTVWDIEKLLWQSNGKGEEAGSVPSEKEDRIPILDSKVYLSSFTVFTKLIKLVDSEIKEEVFEKDERKSPYYQNYVILEKKIKDLEPLDFIPFVKCLLNKVNFAVISADDFGEAIDVFSNLNSKGIPLTDIDVFKAYILRSKSDKDKKEFSDWWNETLCATITNSPYGKRKIDDVLTELFTIYQYHLLALERKGGKDEKAIIPKLRNYFMKDASSRLANVKDYLEKYLDFKKIFDNTRTIEAKDWQDIKITDVEIQKLLDSVHTIIASIIKAR